MNLAGIAWLVVQSTSYERIFLVLLTHHHNSNDIGTFLVTAITQIKRVERAMTVKLHETTALLT